MKNIDNVIDYAEGPIMTPEVKEALKLRFAALLGAFYRIETIVQELCSADDYGLSQLLLDELDDAYRVGLWIMASENEGKVLELLDMNEADMDTEAAYRRFRALHELKHLEGRSCFG